MSKGGGLATKKNPSVFYSEPRSCGDCPLHGNRIVDGEFFSQDSHYKEGDKADFIFIGMNPGKTEDEEGRPFVGRSGILLRAMLEDLGFKDKTVYLTNTYRCLSTVSPEERAIPHCLWRLKDDIARLGDRDKTTLVALGQVALNAVVVPYVQRRGFIEFLGWRVMSTYHPAFLLRSASQVRLNSLGKDDDGVMGEWRRHLQLAFAGGTCAPYKMDIAVDSTKSRYVTFDIETVGLNLFQQDPLLCVGLATEKELAIIPKQRVEDRSSKLIELLEDPNVLKIGQNMKFDIVGLRQAGVKVVPPFFDTHAANFILSGQPRKGLGLKDHSEQYLYDAEALQKRACLSTLSKPKLYPYCATDVLATFDLAKKLSYDLRHYPKMSLLLKKVMMPAMYALSEMEHNGAKIDVRKVRDVDVSLMNELQEAKVKLREHPAVKDFMMKTKKRFRPSSNADIRIVLTDILGVTTGETTPSGLLSTREDDLRELEDQSGFVGELLRYRELYKLLSTYVRNIPNLMDRDGFIHTEFNLTGTQTGRLSSKNPNLQNLPSGTIKSMYVSRFPGGQIMEWDFSQVELRVLAGISRDKALIDAYKNGRDIHTETGKKVLGKDKLTKAERRYAKTVNFGIAYGMTSVGLAARLGVSIAEAEQFIQNYFIAMQGVKEFINLSQNFVEANGYITTKWGRWRRFDMRDVSNLGHIKRAAINTPIQAQASDFVMFSLGWMFNEMLKHSFESKLILTVHDSIVWDVHPAEIDDIIAIAKDGMNNVVNHAGEAGLDVDWIKDIPMMADGEIGDNWGELEPLDKS